ncbi:hypothetical protein [Lacticaseibacillus parakribbianus]|uniref:hypothetical protein n=1 Tax=Lacticaseibacillus parakribbianus TaxID=2970927 RepID=UPI0021CB7D2C|nr:hypothetical protein [Lacticaseibacillus parakribbianus]
MKLPISIDTYTLAPGHAQRGMIRLQQRGETIGLLDRDKLLDDLPRLLGRPLAIDEQVALMLAVPSVAA